ncbi:MAG: hypothetical protein ABI454_02895, partial [Sphingomicrobium sp.]
MLRVVAFRKAILAGAAGAFVWEAVLRLLALAGWRSFDIVYELGTLSFPHGTPAQWWPAGMAAHAVVGVIWAVFYAYFFWARLRWPPALQGLAFAALPSVLATMIMYPQMQLMHLHAQVVVLDWHLFLSGLDPPKLGGLLLGHALFGLTVGAIYTHPVGYVARGAQPKAPRASPVHRRKGKRCTGDGFIFATGIECSYPT